MKAVLKIADKIEVSGNITYQESARAFNTIRIPRQILDQFPDLRNKQIKPFFNMKFYYSYNELKRLIWGMEYSKEQPPIILILGNKNGA